MRPPKNNSFFEGEIQYGNPLPAMGLQSWISQGFLSPLFCQVFNPWKTAQTYWTTAPLAECAILAANATLTMPKG